MCLILQRGVVACRQHDARLQIWRNFTTVVDNQCITHTQLDTLFALVTVNHHTTLLYFVG